MKIRTRLLLAAAFAVLFSSQPSAAPCAAGTFVSDGTCTLPGPKRDARPLPLGTDPNKAVRASDYNSLRDALNDARTHVSGWVNVRSYPGLDPTGATDSTAAVALAYAAAVASKGAAAQTNAGAEIVFPPGRYKFNLVVSSSNITIRGAGARSTWFTPADPAQPVLTFTAASAALIHCGLRDVGFYAQATSGAPAILWTGDNINDQHSIERVAVFPGATFGGSGEFTNGLKVAGRMIYSTIRHVEIDNVSSHGVLVQRDTAGAFIDNTFEHVATYSVGGWGFYFDGSAGGGTAMQSILLDTVNPQSSVGGGIYINNADQFSIVNGYAEGNGDVNVRVTGALGNVSVRDSKLWDAPGHAIYYDATVSYGEINGNRVSARGGHSTPLIRVDAVGESMGVKVGANYGATYQFGLDANGRTRVTTLNPLGLGVTNTPFAATTAVGRGFMQYTNSSPITVSNLGEGMPGQMLFIFIRGAGAVTIDHNSAGGTGRIELRGAADFVMAQTNALLLVYDHTNGVWREVFRGA